MSGRARRGPAWRDAKPARRCLFIAGDPILELRAGRDPHCNAPALGNQPYCARHAARVYYRPEEA